MEKLQRDLLFRKIRVALGRNPVVALVGGRQVGKTTLARGFLSVDSANYFDLEDPVSAVRLENPMVALADLEGLVVIDEVQRLSSLFPVLRVLADREPAKAQFLILGSASPGLMKECSESLAGRIEYIHIPGFSMQEIGCHKEEHWLRGGFPRSYLAANEGDSFAWRRNFLGSLMDRDLAQFGLNEPPPTVARLLTLLAHYHGQICNVSDFSKAVGISGFKVRRYLDILQGAFYLRLLQPWHENLKKRQVKMPKIYFTDTGLLHYFWGVKTMKDLLTHPKVGASWEGYVIGEIFKQVEGIEGWFWAVHQSAELDLLLQGGGRRIGVEIKRVDAPQVTTSMRVALADLHLDELLVIYPGAQEYALEEKVRVVPVTSLCGGRVLD